MFFVKSSCWSITYSAREHPWATGEGTMEGDLNGDGVVAFVRPLTVMNVNTTDSQSTDVFVSTRREKRAYNEWCT